RFVTMVATSSVGVGVRQAAKVVSAPIRYLFAGVKRAFDAWKLVPAVQKQLIYRGLFALGLTITLVNRTFPMAREAIGEGLQKVQKWATDARDLIVTQPLKELNKLLGLPAHSPGAWTLDLMFGAGLVALLYLLYRTACWTQPWRRRSLSYV
ncbi:MAG TPA: hypothetical protein VGE52_15200, partial [Pirellulales bacterium]